jgi:hypothetical protein
MNLKKRINKHQVMAIYAMESNPECRNDDMELIIQVLSNQGVNLTESQKHAIKTCGVEFKTLLRQRQYLQSIGKYLPTRPEVLKKRRKLSADCSEYYAELASK